MAMSEGFIQCSFIVDDGGPVNLLHWDQPYTYNERLVPNAFTLEFAKLCQNFGVQGKFSVVPMPCAIGRIDQSLYEVPPAHLKRFLQIAREQITPNFDITPEILTHHVAVHLPSMGYRHLFEDEWIARASLQEMTDYFVLALRILNNVGLTANGFTSPWDTGITNEDTYVRAMAAAQWKVNRRKQSWYFLHTPGGGQVRPTVSLHDRKTEQWVVSVPANAGDVLWRTIKVVSQRSRARLAREAADRWLTADGGGGEVPALIAQNLPVTLLTHWQSLFSQGKATGLLGLQIFLERLVKRYGDRVRWNKCSALASGAVKAQKKARKW